jgi:hypothetical protein
MESIFIGSCFLVFFLCVLFGIAGPKKIPEYRIIARDEEGNPVLYEVNGAITPEKPKTPSFLERLDQGISRHALEE